MTGEEVIAQSLKNQGIEYMFGVVGIPVQGIAAAVRSQRSARRGPRPILLRPPARAPLVRLPNLPNLWNVLGASRGHRLLRLPQRAGRVVRIGVRRLPDRPPGR